MKLIKYSFISFISIFILSSCGGNNYSYSNDTETVQGVVVEEAVEEPEEVNTFNPNSISSDDDTNTNYIDQTSNQTTSYKKNSEFTGTYNITDEYGTTYSVILNPDKTVVVEGNGRVYYGSWSDSPYDVPKLSFSYDETPHIYFSSGKESIDYGIFSDDGYFYCSNIEYKAKNPRKRLKYSRK